MPARSRWVRAGDCAVWLLAATMAVSASASPFAWEPESTETLSGRFAAPPGTQRLTTADGSFGAWLQTLPLKPAGTLVHYYDGRLKPRRDAHVAVVDLDVGRRDLQQCADAVMRLRAEFLWSAGCKDPIAFNFTSGDRASWADWAAGHRPKVKGSSVQWRQTAAADSSYGQFRKYLSTVFAYAGSHSLAQELEPVDDPSKIRPGDVFIQGGFPGHAVIVMDVVKAADGGRKFLLAQSYMPAQDLHILKNPRDPTSPWYTANATGPLETPEWDFDHRDLKRFPALGCEAETVEIPTHPVHVSGDMTAPRRISGDAIDPTQSSCDRKELQTPLILQTVVHSDGRIELRKFLKGHTPCLENFIREVLKTWRFDPAEVNGRPVSVYYNLSLSTHLR